MQSSLLPFNRLEAFHQATGLVTRDIEMAKNAQAGLFPRRLPPLETLSYAAVCIQALEVGGDYYDFLPLGPGSLGVVVGDVAGKGLGAALLMANLQGVLRSQSMLGCHNLASLLTLTNRFCLENWPAATYATLFLAEYQDHSRRLRYVNCGHPPPILLHPDGSVNELEPTADVIGLFENWECIAAEIQLAPGDTLLAFSDGLTEALNAEGDEFGRPRVIDGMRASERPVSLLLKSMVARVESFMEEQQDDITMLALRCGIWQ